MKKLKEKRKKKKEKRANGIMQMGASE